MDFGFKANELEMINSVFRENPVIKKVVIFGSRAMGNFKPGSDVDMALEGRITEDILAHVRTRLNEDLPLPYVFDLFDRKAINSKALQTHISQFGKIFYSV